MGYVGIVGPWVRALVGVRGLRCLMGSWVKMSRGSVGSWVRNNFTWVFRVEIARGFVGSSKLIVGPKNPRGSEISRGSKNSSWVQNF